VRRGEALDLIDVDAADYRCDHVRAVVTAGAIECVSVRHRPLKKRRDKPLDLQRRKLTPRDACHGTSMPL
jgi:hypothetical protein